MSENLVVRNYPLLPLSEDDQDALAKALDERQMAAEFESATAQLHEANGGGGGGAGTADALPTPRSARMESPRQQSSRMASPREARQQQHKVNAVNGAAANARRHRFLGSLSHQYIDIDACRLIDQLKVTTRMQTKLQMTLLKVHIVRYMLPCSH